MVAPIEMSGLQNQNFSIEDSEHDEHERTPIIGGPRAPNSRRRHREEGEGEGDHIKLNLRGIYFC